jgi:hypothetical protein
VEYSDRANDMMLERNFTEADVAQAVANPARGTYAPPARDRLDHFGYALDGRLLNVVVTNRAETTVITVVEQ